jgi:hypothetical protein
MEGQPLMATLSELVNTIAAVEAIDPATVTLIARYIREAGLIATRGRGPSAATMGVKDAANLLIGVNATTNAAEAAKAVSVYRALESYESREKGDPRPAQKYGTLGEAIEQLVHATGVGELPEVFLNRVIPDDLQEAFPAVHIDMKFRRPIVSASLKITPIEPDEIPPIEPDEITPGLNEEWLEVEVLSIPGEVSMERGTPEGLFFEFCPPKLRGPPRKKKTIAGDRLEEITIGYRTLSAVGKLLHPNG